MNGDLWFIEEGFFFASTSTTKKLAERDEVGWIRNLQVLMKMQEFKKIIDDMYYFIGEQYSNQSTDTHLTDKAGASITL